MVELTDELIHDMLDDTRDVYVGVRVNALEDALETPVDERVGTIEVQTVILDK